MGVPPSGQEHVDRYSETDGEEGHNWHGTAELLLTVQVKADHHTARARFATAEEKPELWRITTATGRRTTTLWPSHVPEDRCYSPRQSTRVWRVLQCGPHDDD